MLLMHKNIPVADIEISGAGAILAVRVLDREHMPVGTYSGDENLTALRLRQWMKTRAIPSERQERTKLEGALGCSVGEAMQKVRGVSLTDCYWFRDDHSGHLTWEGVAYHANGFSKEISQAVLYGVHTRIVDLRSPDFTTDGILRKTWTMADSVPSLVKFGDFGVNAGGKNLLSANEVAAWRLAKRMGIRHAEYFPIQAMGMEEAACITPCFIHNDTEEFVPAHQFAEEHKAGGEDLYHFFVEMGMKDDVDRMIVFDHIIHNTDRHERNFGVIRDPDTLEIRSFAPLFDSGSSFGWNRSPGQKDMGETKPFCGSRARQLELARMDDIQISDEETVAGILRGAYEDFQLPERNLQIAEEDVRKSYEILCCVEGGRT